MFVMPLTVYVDGSGIDRHSPVLTLAACAIEDGLLDIFAEKWNEAIHRHEVPLLHMRKLGEIEDSARAARLVCDALNVFHCFRKEFFYFRVCSVWKSDHAEAQATMPLLRSPELLAVDFCLGGLTIPPTDLDQESAVRIRFDQNEPFIREMRPLWQRARRNPKSGWPRQVGEIETERDHHPGLQAADLFAWAVRRHLLREDQPQLAFSFMLMPQVSRIYDLHTICGLHDASGRYSENVDSNFRATQLRIRFS